MSDRILDHSIDSGSSRALLNNHHKITVAHQSFPFTFGLYGAYNSLSGAYSMYKRTKEIGNGFQNVKSFFEGGGPGIVDASESNQQASEQTSFFKNSASWSLSSLVMYYTGKYAYNHFIQNHGHVGVEQLTDIVHNGWKSAGTKNNTRALESKVLASSDSMHALGASSVGSAVLAAFPEKTKSLMLLVIGTLAVFTHSLGALEMQNQVQKAARDKIWNGDDDSLWDEINPTTSSSSNVPKKEKMSPDGPLRKLYSENEFYKSGKGIKLFSFSGGGVHLVRVIFNIILGASIQFNTFLGSGLSSNDGNDSILQFSRWANMAMYWEILVHLLRLHGWGPLYVALKHVSKLLASSHKKPVSRRGAFAINVTR
jgi:hypothetical protein